MRSEGLNSWAGHPVLSQCPQELWGCHFFALNSQSHCRCECLCLDRSKTQVPRSTIFTQWFSNILKLAFPPCIRCCKHNDCVPSYWSHCFGNNKVYSLCLLVCVVFWRCPSGYESWFTQGLSEGCAPCGGEEGVLARNKPEAFLTQDGWCAVGVHRIGTHGPLQSRRLFGNWIIQSNFSPSLKMLFWSEWLRI